MNESKDAFESWWQWAEKPDDSPLTISTAIHEAVMALPPDERRDRDEVNAAVRDGLKLGPLRSCGHRRPVRRSEGDRISKNPHAAGRRRAMHVGGWINADPAAC